MDIIALFCEIDDFFLAYERWKATQYLPGTPPPETRGCPRQFHPSEMNFRKSVIYPCFSNEQTFFTLTLTTLKTRLSLQDMLLPAS